MQTRAGQNLFEGKGFIFPFSLLAILFTGMLTGTIMWQNSHVAIVLKLQGDHLLNVRGK